MCRHYKVLWELHRRELPGTGEASERSWGRGTIWTDIGKALSERRQWRMEGWLPQGLPLSHPVSLTWPLTKMTVRSVEEVLLGSQIP